MTAGENFRTLFVHHWNSGTGLAEHFPVVARMHKSWNIKTFGDAMMKVGDTAPEPKTIRSWKDGQSRIQPRKKDAILCVFFPMPWNAVTEAACAELDAAWRKLPFGGNYETQDSQLNYDTAQWQLAAPQSFFDELVELRLHQPEPTNRGSFRLRVTFALDSKVKRETEAGEELLVSLHDPFLHLSSPGFPVQDTAKLGRAEAPHPNLISKPNGWSVGEALTASGKDMTNGEPLAEIGVDGSNDGAVTLTLKGGRGTIHLCRIDTLGRQLPTPVPTTEKAAILDALFGSKLGRTADGTLSLASHTMRRKPPE